MHGGGGAGIAARGAVVQCVQWAVRVWGVRGGWRGVGAAPARRWAIMCRRCLLVAEEVPVVVGLCSASATTPTLWTHEGTRACTWLTEWKGLMSESQL